MPNDAGLEDESANNNNNNNNNTDNKDKEGNKDVTESGAAGGASSSSLPRLAPAPSQEEMTSSFRIQTGSNGSAHDKDSSDRGSNNPESAEPRGEAAEEEETTPMDMDAKEPKEEREA